MEKFSEKISTKHIKLIHSTTKSKLDLMDLSGIKTNLKLAIEDGLEESLKFSEWISLEGYIFTADGKWICRTYPYSFIAENTKDLFDKFINGK